MASTEMTREILRSEPSAIEACHVLLVALATTVAGSNPPSRRCTLVDVQRTAAGQVAYRMLPSGGGVFAEIDASWIMSVDPRIDARASGLGRMLLVT